MIEQKIPLTEWGALHYKKPPSAYVLRQWARQGQIFPPPEKVGREWVVPPTARRQTAGRPSLVSRLTGVQR